LRVIAGSCAAPGGARYNNGVRVLFVLRLSLAVAAGWAWTGCSDRHEPGTLSFSSSAVGNEARVVRQQLARFESRTPGVHVDLRVTPDAADTRHQLYVQWLNGRAERPDVLQLDVIWAAEFAAAGWILPLDRFAPSTEDFFTAALEAARWRGRLYAVPWFVDVGLLYWRTDLMKEPPASLAGLRVAAMDDVGRRRVSMGLVWQGARYEGLITVFLEHLAAFGGRILDDAGGVVVDSPRAVEALTFMRDAIWTDEWVPSSVLTWQEEQVRFAFQAGEAGFMRNWPYAWTLLQDPVQSKVAGRIAIAPFPAGPHGVPAAALGGSQLAINRYSAEPERAWQLVQFLAAPEQMAERAREASQLPARRSVYDDPAVSAALGLPSSSIRHALDSAVARPVTPVYSELSDILQLRLHRALTRQQDPASALTEAAAEIRLLLRRTGLERAS
jgi:multiple sugar transport system substrate-binding protein